MIKLIRNIILFIVYGCTFFVYGLITCAIIIPIAFLLGLAYFLAMVVSKKKKSLTIHNIALKNNDAKVSAVGRFLTLYRTPIVIAFVLPLSVLFNSFYYLRNRYIQQTKSMPKNHVQKVAAIGQQILDWARSGSGKKMITARAGWATISPRLQLYKKEGHRIKIDLYDILEVNEEARTVRVEPLVNMGQLTKTLLKKGWTLPIIPELDDLTVGGLICGCGIETSSHQYGLFQSICVSFEILLADGTLVKASKDENAELFYAIPWSYGTLGFLVAAELKIIPAKKYVKLEYHAFNNQQAFTSFFTQQSKKENPADFVECLVYSKDKAIVMLGNMTDTPEKSKINSIGYWWKPWFFEHVQTFFGRSNAYEFIPLRHYYHRHTRSIFWEMGNIMPGANHPVFRWLLGWMIPPKVSFIKLTQTKSLRRMHEEQHVIQDLLVPINTLVESLNFCDTHFEVYPLWLCPMRLFKEKHQGFVGPTETEDMFVDIGAYGIPTSVRSGTFNATETMRKAEKFVRDVKGFQMLYADCYMTNQEFREMFNHTLYDKLRHELGADKAFPQVYDKIKKEVY